MSFPIALKSPPETDSGGLAVTTESNGRLRADHINDLYCDEQGVIWFFALSSSPLVANIELSPESLLIVPSIKGDRSAGRHAETISGVGFVVTDIRIKRSICEKAGWVAHIMEPLSGKVVLIRCKPSSNKDKDWNDVCNRINCATPEWFPLHGSTRELPAQTGNALY